MPMKQGSAATGYACILAAAVCWGGIGPVSRHLFAAGMAPVDVALWRAVLGGVFFGVHALAAGQLRVHNRDLPHLLGFGLWGVALFYVSYQYAVLYSGAAVAAVLLYTAPAWVTVLARIVFRDRLTPLKAAAVAMATLGAAGVAVGRTDEPSGTLSLLGVMCGLTAGVTYALYYIVGKRILERYSGPTLFLYALPAGAAGLLPFASPSLPPAGAWWGLACLSLVSTYGAYLLYSLGVRRLQAATAAAASTLEPVVAATLAYFWWGERFSGLGYMGGMLVIAAVCVLVWADHRSFGAP